MMTVPVVPASTANYLGVVLPSGNVVARTRQSSGGGGGSYTEGLGIYFTGTAPTTIGNTGTIIQPSASTVGQGITLEASYLTNAGGGSGYRAPNLIAHAGSIYITGTAGVGSAGAALFQSGDASRIDGANAGQANFGANGGVIAAGYIQGGNGGFYAGSALGNAPITRGGSWDFYGGAASGGTTNIGGTIALHGGASTDGLGGGITLQGGYGTVGGSVHLSPGTGATNGLIIAVSLPTSDPATPGAFYVDPVTHIVHWK